MQQIQDLIFFEFTVRTLWRQCFNTSDSIISGNLFGICFLVTCAAISALQQLSEAADNRDRYELLRKIGAERRMINQSFFFQVFLYFMMSSGLAIVHSIVGLKVASDVIRIVWKMDRCIEIV